MDLTTPAGAAFVAVTFLAAGIVKGVTGMGLPTVAIGVLGVVMPPAAAASLLVVPSLVTNVWQFAAGPGRLAAIRRLWPMMAAVAFGTLLAASLIAGGGSGWTRVALGTALVVYGLYTLFARQLSVPPAAERWLSPAVGLATGAVTGATGVFVIPAVPYIQALGLSKDALVQALGLSFTVSTLALAAGLALHGAYRIEGALASVLAIAPALAGMALGQALRARVSQQAFRRGFLAALVLLGLELIFRPFS